MKRLFIILALVVFAAIGYGQALDELPVKPTSLSTDTLIITKDGEAALMIKSVLFQATNLDITLIEADIADLEDTTVVHQVKIENLEDTAGVHLGYIQELEDSTAANLGYIQTITDKELSYDTCAYNDTTNIIIGSTTTDISFRIHYVLERDMTFLLTRSGLIQVQYDPITNNVYYSVGYLATDLGVVIEADYDGTDIRLNVIVDDMLTNDAFFDYKILSKFWK